MSGPLRSVLLVTHGVGGRPGVAATHAAALRARGLGEIRVACVKGEPGIDEALADAPAPVTVVPLLMADGFIMQLLRRRIAGRAGIVLRLPLGLHPRLPSLIGRRAVGACALHGWRPAATTLLLVGHGTPRHPGSAAATLRHARTLAACGTFAEVRTAFLDQPSFLAATAVALRRPCVAVGLFVDDGPHGRDDVLAGLTTAAVPVAYTGAIGGDPGLLGLIASAARVRRGDSGRARATCARRAADCARRPVPARGA